MTLTARQASEMRRLRKEGLTLKEIASMFGCSYSTVLRHTSDAYRTKCNIMSKVKYLRHKEDPVEWSVIQEKNRRSYNTRMGRI